MGNLVRVYQYNHETISNFQLRNQLELDPTQREAVLIVVMKFEIYQTDDKFNVAKNLLLIYRAPLIGGPKVG